MMPYDHLLRRIEVRVGTLGGKPVIRKTRIPVELILALMVAGETAEIILDNYPDLEQEDIRACLAYAHALVANTTIDAIEVVGA